MDALPAEILLEIGKTSLATYVSMLAIPKFARAVTVGYRLDMMVVAGYEYNNILNSLYCGHIAAMKRCAGSQLFTRRIDVIMAWIKPLIIYPSITFQDVYCGYNVLYNSSSTTTLYNGQRCSDDGVRSYKNINPVTKIHTIDYFGICLRNSR